MCKYVFLAVLSLSVLSAGAADEQQSLELTRHAFQHASLTIQSCLTTMLTCLDSRPSRGLFFRSFQHNVLI